MNETRPLRPAEDFERLVLMGVALFFLAVVVYIPAMSGGYIYDDDLLLTQNALVTRGTGFLDAQSWQGLAAIWFPAGEKSVNDYAPLSSSMYWLEWRLWGPGSPGGFHAVNIFLHATAALLLWAVLARIGSPGANAHLHFACAHSHFAYVTALVWAVHPVCAESVAWIAERRNVLSTPLLLLVLLAWMRFQAGRKRGDYVAAMALFAAALLAKSAVVMLPFFLLLWIWWARGRVARRDLIETAPFFLLSLVLGSITLWFQYARAISYEQLPVGGLPHRVASACFALAFYAWNALFPFHLDFNYPEWHNTIWPPLQALGIVPFVAAFAWAWRARATWGRHAILGLGFFVIMIAPALGVLKMAYMRITLVADHFEYLPMMGLLALAAAVAARLLQRAGAAAARCALAAMVILFSVLTWKRADVFHDAEALWIDTLAKNPDAWQAHEHLGGILKERHDLTGALEHFRRGVELRPLLGEVHNNYGNALRDLNLLPDVALEENRRAVELSPDSFAPRLSYAYALIMANRPADAIAQYQELQRQLPPGQENPVVDYQIAELFITQNRPADAIGYYEKALQIAPDFAKARERLNNAIELQQKAGEQKP